MALHSLRGALLALLMVLPATAAHANAGPPMRGGDLAAEPTGLEDIDITREALEIDLRPLERGEPVAVNAAYALNNRGEPRDVELMFVTASERADRVQVRLNGIDIPARLESVAAGALPDAWQPPETTPALSRDEQAIGFYPANGRNGSVSTASFATRIPTGESTFNVRYFAEAVRHSRGDPLDTWQFAYSLAPALAWASFGQLDLVVHTPSGWLLAAEPGLTRSSAGLDGDEWRATFGKVPVNAVAITTRAPEPALYRVSGVAFAALFIAALVGGLAVLLRGTWLRGKAQRRYWPVAVLGALAWAGVLFAFGLLGLAAPASLLPATQRSTYGYGAAFMVVGLTLVCILALILGVIGGLISGALGRRRS